MVVRFATIRSAMVRRGAFSLAELLVVVGVIALLIAITLPPLQLARHEAMITQCQSNLRQLGAALEDGRMSSGFYPIWDDGGASVRYTWIDVLIQQRRIDQPVGADQGDAISPAFRPHIAYCPADPLPDPLNAARHSGLIYPLDRNASGVDYSYGIGVPLSAGGWKWRPRGDGENGTRRFDRHERDASRRVLIADATDPAIYNLSGRVLSSNIWNDPTQFDNSISWRRHAISTATTFSANALYQDGHAGKLRYDPQAERPIDTGHSFVWRPHEPLFVNPSDQFGMFRYPNQLPSNFQSNPPGDTLPSEMIPAWYTVNRRWTRIRHK